MPTPQRSPCASGQCALRVWHVCWRVPRGPPVVARVGYAHTFLVRGCRPLSGAVAWLRGWCWWGVCARGRGTQHSEEDLRPLLAPRMREKSYGSPCAKMQRQIAGLQSNGCGSAARVRRGRSLGAGGGPRVRRRQADGGAGEGCERERCRSKLVKSGFEWHEGRWRLAAGRWLREVPEGRKSL